MRRKTATDQYVHRPTFKHWVDRRSPSSPDLLGRMIEKLWRRPPSHSMKSKSTRIVHCLRKVTLLCDHLENALRRLHLRICKASLTAANATNSQSKRKRWLIFQLRRRTKSKSKLPTFPTLLLFLLARLSYDLNNQRFSSNLLIIMHTPTLMPNQVVWLAIVWATKISNATLWSQLRNNWRHLLRYSKNSPKNRRVSSSKNCNRLVIKLAGFTIRMQTRSSCNQIRKHCSPNRLQTQQVSNISLKILTYQVICMTNSQSNQQPPPGKWIIWPSTPR